MTHPDDTDDDMFYGDPRRCPHHNCVTSSTDGMHDCPCPMCEAEIEEAEEQDDGGVGWSPDMFIPNS